MKNIQCKILIIAAFFLLVACGGRKHVQQRESDLPVFEFTQTDTSTINTLAEVFVTELISNNYEGAADLLRVVRNDSIYPLSLDQRNGYTKAMRALPIVGCSLRELKLYSDRDNELRIALMLSENANPETGEGCVNFFLNPVEQDGQWYLTLRDKYAEGVGLYH